MTIFYKIELNIHYIIFSRHYYNKNGGKSLSFQIFLFRNINTRQVYKITDRITKTKYLKSKIKKKNGDFSCFN